MILSNTATMSLAWPSAVCNIPVAAVGVLRPCSADSVAGASVYSKSKGVIVRYRLQHDRSRQGIFVNEKAPAPRLLRFNFSAKLHNRGMNSLAEIVRHSDDLLRLKEIEDYPNALNGLQVENSGEVTKIGAAVDASTHTMQTAGENGVDLLVVHHGLFWPGLRPIRGPLYRSLRLALGKNLALYSVHLPLDLHPRLGNNALFAAALGLEKTEPFLELMGQ